MKKMQKVSEMNQQKSLIKMIKNQRKRISQVAMNPLKMIVSMIVFLSLIMNV